MCNFNEDLPLMSRNCRDRCMCQRSRSADSNKRCVHFAEEKFSNMQPPSFLCKNMEPYKRKKRSSTSSKRKVEESDEDEDEEDDGEKDDDGDGDTDEVNGQTAYDPGQGAPHGSPGFVSSRGYGATPGVPGYGGPGGGYGQGMTSGMPGYDTGGQYGQGATPGRPGYSPGGGYAQGVASGVPGYDTGGQYGQGGTTEMPGYGPVGGYRQGATRGIPRDGLRETYGQGHPTEMPGYGPGGRYGQGGTPGYGPVSSYTQENSSEIARYGPGGGHGPAAPSGGTFTPGTMPGMPGYGPVTSYAPSNSPGIAGYDPGIGRGQPVPPGGAFLTGYGQDNSDDIASYGPGGVYGQSASPAGGPGMLGYGPLAGVGHRPRPEAPGRRHSTAGILTPHTQPFDPCTGETCEMPSSRIRGEGQAEAQGREFHAQPHFPMVPCEPPVLMYSPYNPLCAQCCGVPPGMYEAGAHVEDGSGAASVVAKKAPAKKPRETKTDKSKKSDLVNCCRTVNSNVIERFCKSLQIPCPPCDVQTSGQQGCFLVVPMSGVTSKKGAKAKSKKSSGDITKKKSSAKSTSGKKTMAPKEAKKEDSKAAMESASRTSASANDKVYCKCGCGELCSKRKAEGAKPGGAVSKRSCGCIAEMCQCIDDSTQTPPAADGEAAPGAGQAGATCPIDLSSCCTGCSWCPCYMYGCYPYQCCNGCYRCCNSCYWPCCYTCCGGSCTLGTCPPGGKPETAQPGQAQPGQAQPGQAPPSGTAGGSKRPNGSKGVTTGPSSGPGDNQSTMSGKRSESQRIMAGAVVPYQPKPSGSSLPTAYEAWQHYQQQNNNNGFACTLNNLTSPAESSNMYGSMYCTSPNLAQSRHRQPTPSTMTCQRSLSSSPRPVAGFTQIDWTPQ